MSGTIRIALAGLLVAAAGASAQLSPWYITDFSPGFGNTHVMQSGVQQFQYQWASTGQMPIYVGKKVRQAEYSGTGLRGDQYSLGGSPTNVQNFWNDGGAPATDAGFDGKNVYMVESGGQVSMWDANYANGVNLFQANSLDISITYDGVNQTIWTSDAGGPGTLSQWNPLTGQLISSLSVPSLYLTALAWDPLDDSLWVADALNNKGLQINKNTGQVLQSIQLPGFVMGGEMPIGVPSPGAAALAGLGGIVAMRRRR